MSVSLYNVGNVQLGKTGDVKLSELNAADANDRVYSNASIHYKRVNALEVGTGTDEYSRAPLAVAYELPVNLSEWMDDNGNPYQQWNTDTGTTYVNRGTAFKLTGGTATADCSGPTTCTATFTWTRPTYYGDFDPQSIVRQTLWVYPCSPNTQVGCEDDSPFSGTRQVILDSSPTGTQAQHTGLAENAWHIAGVRMEWNDEDSDDPYKQLGIGYYTASAHGGSTPCDDCASGGPAIIFKTAVAPVCNGNDCGLGNSRINACDDFASYPSSQAYQKVGGGLSDGDTVWNSGCTVKLTGYIAFGGGPGDSYSITNGVIDDNAQECFN